VRTAGELSAWSLMVPGAPRCGVGRHGAGDFWSPPPHPSACCACAGRHLPGLQMAAMGGGLLPTRGVAMGIFGRISPSPASVLTSARPSGWHAPWPCCGSHGCGFLAPGRVVAWWVAILPLQVVFFMRLIMKAWEAVWQAATLVGVSLAS
jgi:hypothetical protein